ncbi:MAG: hypothetical protein QG623_85 [Patescibacteria group bacterium]|nr:hypothetical protein [Patescibacteria group bacterium]
MTAKAKMKPGQRLTRVQFQPQQIPEAQDRSTMDRYLVASLLGELPGIIIREDTKRLLEIGSHDDLVEHVRLALLEQGAEFKAGPTKTKVKPHGVGDLHTDGVEAVDKVLNLNVHSTDRGEGDLLFGLPGHAAKGLIDVEGRSKPGFGTLAVRSVWEKPLHRLALGGETFAELIDPNNVFTGRVSEGDSVVIALESAKGPMFHRFDTDTEDREASITELNRPA